MIYSQPKVSLEYNLLAFDSVTRISHISLCRSNSISCLVVLSFHSSNPICVCYFILRIDVSNPEQSEQWKIDGLMCPWYGIEMTDVQIKNTNTKRQMSNATIEKNWWTKISNRNRETEENKKKGNLCNWICDGMTIKKKGKRKQISFHSHPKILKQKNWRNLVVGHAWIARHYFFPIFVSTRHIPFS